MDFESLAALAVVAVVLSAAYAAFSNWHASLQCKAVLTAAQAPYSALYAPPLRGEPPCRVLRLRDGLPGGGVPDPNGETSVQVVWEPGGFYVQSWAAGPNTIAVKIGRPQ
ncbi:MAG: hypothetical protein ACPL3C_08535 [Pyrobaculum sp.]